jgi:hypothetical protein
MRDKWREEKYDFYLLGYGYLYVFRKPATGEKMSEFKNSVKWGWASIEQVLTHKYVNAHMIINAESHAKPNHGTLRSDEEAP